MQGQGLATIVLLSLAFAAWFGAGYRFNVRRKAELLRSLRSLLGEPINYASLGSSGFVFLARRGVVRVSVTLLLGKREFPVMWLVDRLRGRGDRVEVKAEGPRVEACVGITCLNRSSYWGRLLYRRLAQGPGWRDLGAWSCRGGRNPLVEELKSSEVYALRVKARKDRCYVSVVCGPGELVRVLGAVLGYFGSTPGPTP